MAQLEDLAIRPILEKKLKSEDRPSCQEFAPENSATKRYWALWASLHLKDVVLYRKWASDDGRSCRCRYAFCRTLRLPCDIVFVRPSDTPSSPYEYLDNLEVRWESVHVFARERFKLVSPRMKTRYYYGATDHHLNVGDQVWMYNPK
ncbi:hypothetical protein AVEN_274997-1 [Araneus ventricosus]|uniref:Uncharacterized protein n=1 Tax=Araneus ventricosus TaxID=182803 RepID=A0A4Y2V4I3_ARAVE|nr:hypothetical protein AVEN_274997-1 [Araneus ventricosus]